MGAGTRRQTLSTPVPAGKSTPYAPEATCGPPKQELRDAFKQQTRLCWITVAYQLLAVVIVSTVAGGSQALKTEWVENALAILPPLAVLLTHATENRDSDARHPFGYQRIGTIAFLGTAFLLLGIGVLLSFEAAQNLLTGERPAIGGIALFGHTVWRGWVMIVVLIVTAVPPVLLARAKLKVAKLLHDKPLFADADINEANWLSNGAGVIGLVLVAFGFWWGDSAAALLISLDILRDGFRTVRRSLADVMDRAPVDMETDKPDPLLQNVYNAVRAVPWVADVRVLLREHGRYVFAEIFVSTTDNAPPPGDATLAIRQAAMPLDWRLRHVAVELTNDVEQASNILTRSELDIEG